MSLLVVDQLKVRFPGKLGFLTAVDGVSLKIDQGEVLGIVGESGSGKSVSMHAVMGLIDPPGEVEARALSYRGHDLLAMTAHGRRAIAGRKIGMIFQNPTASLNPSFSIGFQMAETLRLSGTHSRREATARAAELLSEVGISDPFDRLKAYPHQLSGGMNQRIMIAIAIAANPELLIADEPTTALDVTVQAQIMELLLKLRAERGMTIILITHNIALVAQIADRVAVMYAGQIVEEQPAASLFDTPQHPYTEALLHSLPENARGGRLRPIPGQVPALDARPIGCQFAPRCAYAVDDVCSIAPELRAWGNGMVRCHFPLGETAGQASEAPS
jgi:dipeptide transport system ATP-binding protein